MEKRKEEIIEVIENLIQVREVIFTQIVNISMSGEMNHINKVFDFEDRYTFNLSHFEDVGDINVEKLLFLCKKVEEIVFSMIDLNGINENEIKL